PRQDGRPEDVSASMAFMGLYSRRLWINRFNLAVSLLTMLIGLFWLAWILLTLFEAGFKALGPALFLTMTPPPGASGGLSNAIAGSLIMAATATLIGTPIGMMAGIYLAEFGSRGWLAPVTRRSGLPRSEEHTSELQSRGQLVSR